MAMKNKLILIFLLFAATSFSFAQLNCYQQDTSLYQYYARLVNVASVNSDFNKADFMAYITANGNLSAGDLNILSAEIVSVSKSFPISQTVQNVVSIDANAGIYSILFNASSISDVECRGNPVLLNVKDTVPLQRKLSVTRNPVDDTSQLRTAPEMRQFTLIVTNAAGRILHKDLYRKGDRIFLHHFIQEKGVYFLTVIDPESHTNASLKVLK